MNIFRKAWRMVFHRDYLRVFTWGSRYDYSREVGDGTGSSTVMAPVLWACRTFPEAPPMLWDKLGNNQFEQIDDHDMLRLLERPNVFYSGSILWMATVADFMVNGDAYWLKEWNRAGTRPVRLWFTPSWMIVPQGSESNPNVFIDHYRYTVDGQPFDLDPSDVVHFRFGLDPDNPRKGFSPLKSVLKEVYTDDEAARFTASLLRNMGIPGLIVSPDTDSPITQPEAEATKQYMKDKFGGDRRGEPMVMTGRTKVEQFGFSPDQMLLRDLRKVPEERVTAVLGIPASVAGLGAGLDRNTFTNYGEARSAAYEQGIIPMQKIMGEDVRFQLLTDFEKDVHPLKFGFDLSQVRVLQEDIYKVTQAHDLAVRGGWEMVSEARRAKGLEVDEDRDNVFLRQLNVNTIPATDAGDFIERPIPNTTPVVDQNVTQGNGHASEVADAVIRELELRAARKDPLPLT
jgi:HK97 family phage portal protein